MAQRMSEFIPKEMPWEDVMQYGCVGLIEAMERYEDSKGKFSTFASFRIYGSIMEGIFQFLGIKRRGYRGRWGLEIIQLADPIDFYTMSEGVRQSEAGVEGMKEKIEEKLSLKKALQSLNPEERELVDAYYFQQKSWDEYAQEKHVNVAWVHLMHRRILKKLRMWLCC